MTKDNDAKVVLNSENYAEWSLYAELELGAVEGWEMVVGDERPPPNNASAEVKRDFKKRRAKVIHVFNDSIGQVFKHLIRDNLPDVAAIWTAIALAVDRSKDPIFVNNIRDTFNKEAFSPPEQTVLNFVDKLRALANKIRNVEEPEQPYTDIDIKFKLLNSLPREDANWQLAKSFCLTNEWSLQECIQHLTSNEAPRLEKAEKAATAGHNGGRRGSGRGGNRGRGNNYDGGNFEGNTRGRRGNRWRRRGNAGHRGYSNNHRGARSGSDYI